MMKDKSKIITYSEPSFNNSAALFLKKELLNLSKKKAINIAISGGQSPLPVYDKLKEFDLIWNKMNFFLVDERCVPNTDKQSNFGNLNNNFFKNITSKSFPIIKEGLTLREMATEYERKIKHYLKKENGIPQFDLIILGMGLDGHTASLFPKTKALKNNKNLVVVNNVPQLKTKRITMTYPLLLNSNKIILIAKGEKKKELLYNIGEKHPISKIIPQIYKVIN